LPALRITVCTFLETWPALFFFAGFHMPRYAVPFSGIKAKKIPIVQPKLTSGREKIHKKFLLFKINWIKTRNFPDHFRLVNGIFLVLYEKHKGTAYPEVR
jgi:hypothetical protein